ncbi:MAG: tRNA preQ1(34) S-adenosylmethionine ribosyltransferase-isomerase QueA [Proteobacteria bacterium]|nr:tRNA preQ1(34) S-adenosylmethionine ribosyltransferase-isomerase QueA [Pseudomonadota bacterium]MCP4920150.1 tRNA preQ1(34) S-adenosylmethionine ribosyltransferase-isomerase QueA [Pseudomonadota bacterium]
MDLSAYDFALPSERIAVHPPPERDGGRMLVLGDRTRHAVVPDVVDLLQPGDVLVVNDTRVLHARLRARRATGGAVEVFVLGEDRAMLRPARRLKVGEHLQVDDAGTVELLEKDDEGWRVRFHPSAQALMDAVGEVPLPPYLERSATETDRERYQTVFAEHPGAVAAPTAGLHLTEALLRRLRDKGVQVVTITLHVGAGTFRNLRAEDLERGELHPERYVVTEETARVVNACTGRVVAVGTTVTRTLESAVDADGVLVAGGGVTRLFLQEGARFRRVDALLTNFHLPRSSLLMLVCAFAGRERVLAAYDEAIRDGYRFYSYGDAMLVLPGRGYGWARPARGAEPAAR